MSKRILSLAGCGLVLFLSPMTVQAQQMGTPTTTGTATKAAPKAPDVKVDAASQAIAEAAVAMGKHEPPTPEDLDLAVAKLSDAIKADPKMSGPYVFRASVYYQKKMWPEAEADFKSALALDPKNVVIQLNIVEIKFAQKKFAEARVGYLALQNDPDLGSLVAYKIFLCDLMLGHEQVAMKERDDFDQVRRAPAYYFANAAWDLYHKKNDSARTWLISAANIFPSAKIYNYAMPLKDLGYLPIAAPSSVTNTPAEPVGR